ncbi:MAG: alanine racemase, partial [Noviherbaspirillum sp.]
MTIPASNFARTPFSDASPLPSIASGSGAHRQGTSSASNGEQSNSAFPSHRNDSGRWALFNQNSPTNRRRSGSLPSDADVFKANAAAVKAYVAAAAKAHAAAAKRKTEQENAKMAAGTIMTINSDAILHNLDFAKKRLTELAEAAGRPVPERAMVLKANGYGIGAPTLAGIGVKAGVRHFFVAHFSEAKELRQGLIDQGVNLRGVNINVLHGPMPGTEKLFLKARCTPVLNSLEQIKAWGKLAEQERKKLPAILQFDSGMRRAGVSREEVSQFLLSEEEVSFLKSRGATLDLEGVKNLSEKLLSEISDEDVKSMNESDGRSLPESAMAVQKATDILIKYDEREALLKNIDVKYVMSHLACAGDMKDPTNEEQLNAFKKIHEQFPGVGASLAASPGFYLGSDFHFDMVRLGSLVHGMESSESPSPLEPAIKL